MSDDDISSTILAKSDQLNAEDLMAGPRTIRIRETRVLRGDEQPVLIYFDGDDGKPWKPCKSMRRVLAKVWGKYASKWVGKRLTIWNDPTVKWAGAEVGGIRISHMEGIDSPQKMALTETRSKRKPFVVKPLDTSGTGAPPEQGPDKATRVADQLVDRIKSHPNPVEITQEAKVIEQRDWLEKNRPELAQRVTDALAAHNRQQRNDPPPQADMPDYGDDGGYEGG